MRGYIDQVNVDFKEYVFEINVLFKNIIGQLKECEEGFIVQAEKSMN